MRWTSFQDLVVLPNTLFGLPWLATSISLVLCDPILQPRGYSLFWKILLMCIAFASARIAGMSFNRLIDHTYDAANPRTKSRALPMGEISRHQVRMVAWASVGLFVLACAMINLTCLMLAPILVCLLWGYSYLKRVTPMYHMVMALNHFFIPIFTWAAITGSIGIPALYLGLAILCLITANDIVYSLQDVAFDRSYGLHSFGTALGEDGALWLVRALHVLFLLLMLDFGVLLSLPWIFYSGIVLVGTLLAYLHRGLDVNDSHSCNMFLFQGNVMSGFVLMTISIGTAVWQRL